MEKRSHLQRVGKDSAGSTRASFSVPIIKIFLGENPQTPHQAFIAPDLDFIWQASFPDLSLDRCLEHHRRFTYSAGSLLGLSSAGSHKGHGSKFLSSHFQQFLGGRPPPNPHQAFVDPEWGFTCQAPFPDLILGPCLEHHGMNGFLI